MQTISLMPVTENSSIETIYKEDGSVVMMGFVP
jgi:hypothetical protein